MDTIRIFISSPGDVAEERERARQVVQGLRRRYARHFDIVPVVWEEMPLGLDASFQEGIDPLLSKEQGVDIAVFILWSRLGSALGGGHARPDGRACRSGTERELDMMLQARAAQGGTRPHILAYTRDDEVSFEESLRGKSTTDKEESIRQKRLVEGFIREQFHDARTGTNLRAYHTYQRPQTFGERLRVHLHEILDGLSAGRSGRPAWDIEHRGPPFLGLESFSFAHAEVFFGREDEVLEGRLRLAAAARRGTAFLLVSGGSGTGKSSLAAAGILPEIVAHETDEQVARWFHAAFTPAALAGDPAAGMARRLMEAVPGLTGRIDSTDFATALRDGPAAAVRLAVVPALKAQATAAGGVRLALLVDQLEELFTDPRFDDASRDCFAAILMALATSGHVWVVATVRGDFYARLVACEGLRRLKSEGGQLDLGPPAADALRRMIESPALLAGLAYEQTGDKTLADRILRDVAGQAELLPLLEDLLRELFEARSSEGVLTVAAYESLGGIAGALARRAEASVAALPPDAQRAFGDVLRRLVAVGEGGETGGVRRRARLDSFAVGTASRAVVDRLVVDRLATAAAGRDGVPEVAIAHEAILRLWPRAAAWIADNVEGLRLRDRLSARMKEQSPLSGGDPLVPAARAVLDTRPEVFEPELAAYVTAQLRSIDAERWRQVLRRRLLVGVAAVVAVAVTLGGLAMQARADRQRRMAEAQGAVAALERAGSGQISAAAAAATLPAIAPYADPLLRVAFSRADDRAKKLRAALGLVRLPAAGEEVWNCLAESLLTAEPAELVAIRSALALHEARFRDLFWERARGDDRAARLRAAAALAAYDPAVERWREIAPAVAGDLVTVPAVHLADWLAALREVRRVLVPALVPIFADPRRREVERSLAADILADYAADDPAVLADLAMTAEPNQFPAVAAQVEARFSEVGPLLEAEIEASLPEDLSSSAPQREVLGIRQAKAAAVLVRFGRADRVWPLFIQRADPRVRSHLQHFLEPFGARPEPLVERLDVEQDLSARRGLVLALGEMAGKSMADGAGPAAVRARLVPRLREMFEADPDPGLHAAVAWTLGQFGDGAWVAGRQEYWREEAGGSTKQSSPLAKGLRSIFGGKPPAREAPAAGSPRLAAIIRALGDDGSRAPRWFVNAEGQTLVVVPGPVEFTMGSPAAEAGRGNDETVHRRRISRSFAISAAPVTLGQYERLVGLGNYGKVIAMGGGPRLARSPDLPVVGLNWFMAAAYCNALSEAEGIPKSEWAYEEDEKGTLRLAAGWLARSGYRLPTESEWEYAARAGAATSRFYGETATLLGSHAWYLDNSAFEGQAAPWPVGLKKPNDLGLCDVLGNVFSWCQDALAPYPEAVPGGVVEDEEGECEIAREEIRVLRGGTCDRYASILRSGYRYGVVPTNRIGYFGLRVARTLPHRPLTPVPAAGGDGEARPAPKDRE